MTWMTVAVLLLVYLAFPGSTDAERWQERDLNRWMRQERRRGRQEAREARRLEREQRKQLTPAQRRPRGLWGWLFEPFW